MNYKLLLKHAENALKFEFPKMEKDGSNSAMFFCADVVGSRRFATNYGGYPASDIAEINRAATMQEQLNLLQNLQDYSPSSNSNSGLTDAEIMLGHKSKYLQTPSEVVTWLERRIAERDAKRFANDGKGDTIDFVETDVPKTEIKND